MYQIGFIRKTTFIFLLLRVLFMYSRCSVFFSHQFFLALSCLSHDTSNVFQFMSFHVGPAFVSLPSISLFHFAQFEHYFVFTSFIYLPPWWNTLNLFINLCASLPLSLSISPSHTLLLHLLWQKSCESKWEWNCFGKSPGFWIFHNAFKPSQQRIYTRKCL